MNALQVIVMPTFLSFSRSSGTTGFCAKRNSVSTKRIVATRSTTQSATGIGWLQGYNFPPISRITRTHAIEAASVAAPRKSKSVDTNDFAARCLEEGDADSENGVLRVLKWKPTINIAPAIVSV